MDHHCIWMNKCIALHNHRYFIQLTFHASLSSFYTLLCFYDVSFYPKIYNEILGDPFLWSILHLYLGVFFGIYTFLNFWLIYKDQTSMELITLVFSKDKFVPKFERKSFNANMLMIFGTSNIFKALFYPQLNLLPINGLEYEYERMQHRCSNLRENNDFWQFNE
eukprot:403367978